MEHVVLTVSPAVARLAGGIVEIIFARSWKALALRGVVGILFGLVAFLRPGITLSALVLLFGAYCLIDGILAIVAGTRQRAREYAFLLAIEGLIGVSIGVVAFLWTGMTALVLIDLIAFWAIFTGLLEIAAAVRVRRALPGVFLLGLGGVASVVLGVMALLWPAAGALVIVALLGWYALFFGAALLLLALRLRRLSKSLEPFCHELDPQHRTA
jgi:uncharacterized membrane protein HdeD (DUF308 family)